MNNRGAINCFLLYFLLVIGLQGCGLVISLADILGVIDLPCDHSDVTKQ